MPPKPRRGRQPPPPRGAPLALPTADASGPVRWITRVGLLLIVGASIALVVYVRLRLAGIPLERDEGEYAYAGQLILNGVPPYELAYNMKFPGTYYAYAGLMAVLGQTPWGIRVGLLGWHLATLALLFVLGRRIVGTLGAGAGTAAFAILAIDRWSMGVFAHATHFVLLPVLAGLLVLDSAIRSGRARWFVLAGVCAGVAVIMKQQALSFGLLFVALAAWSGAGRVRGRLAWRHGALVAGGLAAAFGVLIAGLAIQGVLGRFWFWTFQYAAAYVTETPASLAIEILGLAWRYVTQATVWVWYTAALGLALLWTVRWAADSRRALAAWLVAAVLSIAPGFFFRPHYFILLMPPAGLLVGVAIASIDALVARRIGGAAARVVSLAILAGLLGASVQRDAHYVVRMGETELVRSLYADNPFLEAPEIGRYLAARTTAADRIGVLGSEPEILFYANRASATGYIYTYPLMEPQPYAQRMQAEMRREVESARPAYLVVSGVPASWGARPGSDLRILTWANEFATTCYDLVGLAEVDPRQGPIIRWDAEVAGYEPRLDSRVTIFRRKAGAPCGGPDQPGTPGAGR